MHVKFEIYVLKQNRAATSSVKGPGVRKFSLEKKNMQIKNSTPVFLTNVKVGQIVDTESCL